MFNMTVLNQVMVVATIMANFLAPPVNDYLKSNGCEVEESSNQDQPLSNISAHTRTGFAPTFLKNIPVVDAFLGMSQTLWCKFSGYPLPNVVFTKHMDGVKKQIIITNHNVSIDMNGVARMRIEKVESDMAGQYSCHARNKFGKAEGRMKVNVMCASYTGQEPTEGVKRP